MDISFADVLEAFKLDILTKNEVRLVLGVEPADKEKDNG
jgi:hypothetical protein